MRLVKFSSLLFGIVVLLLTSCSKYEEGPAISLRSKKERVVNTWDVDKWITEDGDIVTQNASSITMTFEESNDVSISVTALGQNVQQNGEWEFQNDKEELGIIFENYEYECTCTTNNSATTTQTKEFSDESEAEAWCNSMEASTDNYKTTCELTDRDRRVEENNFTILLLKEDEMKLEGDGLAEMELSEE